MLFLLSLTIAVALTGVTQATPGEEPAGGSQQPTGEAQAGSAQTGGEEQAAGSLPAEEATAETPPERTLAGDGPVVITESCVIAPGTYLRPDPESAAAVVIRGEDLVVDFQGAELVGAKAGEPADQFTGRGILIEGSGITLRNARVRGYKIGIQAIDVPGLTLEACDVSGNYRQRLHSSIEREDTRDWLYPHHNDKQEWLRYGAGIYLLRCPTATVHACKAHNGQNGLMMNQCDKGRIYENDMSFLSGWGLAMWRCNENVVARNAFDFCVRGYSHGQYNRGQDSAGILMFEQNNGNTFAYNSATHGGDGVFAFGGSASLQRSERTGNNENLFLANDLSYAAAHGLELTFSFENLILYNNLVGNAICGVWGGYSQETLIAHNVFRENGEAGYGLERGGVNIEHGARNAIVANTFRNNEVGVHLWDDDDAQVLELPWSKANHVGCVDNMIARNVFLRDRLALHLRDARRTSWIENDLREVGKKWEVALGSEPITEGTVGTRYQRIAEAVMERKFPGTTSPLGARREWAGRENIFVTDWGPYDFTDTRLFPERIAGSGSALGYVLTPGLPYRITNIPEGVTVEPASGTGPVRVSISASSKAPKSFRLSVEVDGQKNVADVAAEGGKQVTGSQENPEGHKRARVQKLVWPVFLLGLEWDVRFYAWESAVDPREAEANWTKIIEAEPLHQERTKGLTSGWQGRGPHEKVPADHFATVATSKVELPAGKWRIRTVSDDGVRVYVDGKRVIDNWTWHAPTEDAAELDLAAGAHTIRVEHFEIDGWAWLEVHLEPVAE
jgi:hypothetical protein